MKGVPSSRGRVKSESDTGLDRSPSVRRRFAERDDPGGGIDHAGPTERAGEAGRIDEAVDHEVGITNRNTDIIATQALGLEQPAGGAGERLGFEQDPRPAHPPRDRTRAVLGVEQHH